VVEEGSRPAGTARRDEPPMPQPAAQLPDLLLESARVDDKRQRPGQHLHQKAAAGRLFERHEHAATADGSHLALHPVPGLERVPQCRAEIGHERANMVAGCRRPQPSQRRYEILFDFDPHRDLAQAPVHGQDHTELRVEVVLEHRGAGVLQVDAVSGPSPSSRTSRRLRAPPVKFSHGCCVTAVTQDTTS